jgi:hypothetical protein
MQTSNRKLVIETESLKDQAKNILEEARMVLPGLQALFGFQLIAVFSQRFEQLDTELQVIHLIAIGLTTIAIALVMTPAAYDRIAEQDVVSDYFVRLSSKLVAAAMMPLATALNLDLYIIFRIVLDDMRLSILTAAAAMTLCCCLWFIFPLWHRVQGRRLPRRKDTQ